MFHIKRTHSQALCETIVYTGSLFALRKVILRDTAKNFKKRPASEKIINKERLLADIVQSKTYRLLSQTLIGFRSSFTSLRCTPHADSE